MPRSSLAPIIAKTRRLIADPAGATQQFSDDEIQDVLDAGNRRRDVHLFELRPADEIVEGGTTVYRSYWADGGWWEEDATVQDNTYKVLTTVTSPIALSNPDYSLGLFRLTASLNPPVYLSGKQFDIYNAAADLLEEWIAVIKMEFDFLALGRTFKRSQKIDHMERLVERYRQRGGIAVSEMVRTDGVPVLGYAHLGGHIL